MATEDSDEERRQIIRGFEQRYKQAQAKHLQTEADAAQAKREVAEAEAAYLRAQFPAILDNMCIWCWANHGRKSMLHAAPHEDPEHYDRMQCSCGHFEDRPA